MWPGRGRGTIWPNEVDVKTYEFWREMSTGDVWAVELTDGVVTGAAGPLHWSEIRLAYLHGYDYSPGEAARIEAVRDDFELVDEKALLLFSASAD